MISVFIQVQDRAFFFLAEKTFHTNFIHSLKMNLITRFCTYVHFVVFCINCNVLFM